MEQTWRLRADQEIVEWLDSMPVKQRARAARYIDLLGEHGNALGMPYSRPLGGGLFELRFDLAEQSWRVTYQFLPGRRIVLLTAFTKQRQVERHEIDRARRKMRRQGD